MKVQIINPLMSNGWDDLLAQHGGYSFFYSSAWARVLSESYHYTPSYFLFTPTPSSFAVVPIMGIRSWLTGNRGISLPFSDHCEVPIEGELAYDEFLAPLIQYGKKAGWSHLEFRGPNISFRDMPVFSSYFGHTLDISMEEDKVFQKIKSATRRNIKKASKAAIKIRIDNSFEAVRAFYKLHCLTRRRHGLPPQPFEFFRKIHKHVFSRDLGIVVTASYKGQEVAAAVYFHFGDLAMYKFGASDLTYQHLRPNNLVMWEAIKWYCRRKYRKFDFGRTELDNSGLRRFKRNWGTEERIIPYYRYHLTREVFLGPSGRQRTALPSVFKRMPAPLLRLVGTILYKHIA